MTITLDGTLGITTPTTNGTGEHVTSVTGFKNRIINGGMVIDQRNAGASVTISTSSPYTVDRIIAGMSGGTGSIQQVTGTGGFKYAMRMTGAAGITDGYFGQKIESYNISDCASTTVTYTIRASSSVLTSLTWYARFPTAQDNYSGVTLITSGSVTINSTPTNYSFQIALPSGVTNGFELYFTFGGFTSGTLDITGVQLEKGSTATSFDYRPYGTELALCQRYYQIGDIHLLASNTSGDGTVSFPVQMRTSPTYTFSDSSGNASKYTDSAGGNLTLAVNANTVNSYRFRAQTALARVAAWWEFNYTLSAEL